MIDLAERDRVVGPVTNELLANDIGVLGQFPEACINAILNAIRRENPLDLINLKVESAGRNCEEDVAPRQIEGSIA